MCGVDQEKNRPKRYLCFIEGTKILVLLNKVIFAPKLITIEKMKQSPIIINLYKFRH